MSDQMSWDEGERSWRTGRSARAVDDVDRRILAELTKDGRLSVRALAERVHISRANAYARVNQLLADGVITGFSADLDPERAGFGTSAYVMLTIQQNTWREVSAAISQLPYIEHFALVGGDFDVLALVRAPDNAALRHVVLERIQEIEGVRGTRTWLIFDEHDGHGADWT
jgi:DNA-binding Lrp family transcriptional regulator